MNKFITADGFMIDDTVINSGVKFTQSINADQNLQMGVAAKAEVTFTILDPELTVFTEALPWLFSDGVTNWTTQDDDILCVNGDPFNALGYEFLWKQSDVAKGYFTIDSITRENDFTYKIKMYDRMHKFEKSADAWWQTVNFPISISSMLQSLCAYVGVICVVNDTTNSNFMVSNNASYENVTAREVLSWMLGVMGNFAYFNDEGKLVVDFYQTTEKKLTSTYYKSQTVADFVVPPIDKVQIKVTENDLGVIVGTGVNAYIIENNPLLYTTTSSTVTHVATALLTKLGELTYTPCTAEHLTAYDVQLGDIIEVETRRGVISTLVMQISQPANEHVQEISSTGNTNRTQVNSVGRTVKQLNGRMLEIVAELEEFSVKLTDLQTATEADTTTMTEEIGQLSVTATQIQTSVSAINTSITDLGTAVTANSASITTLSDNITSTVESVNNQGTQISTLEQKVDGFTLSVDNGKTSSTIKLKADGALIDSATIRFTGTVVFASDLSDGNTSIDGSCINSGTIGADYIELRDEMTVYNGRSTGGTFGYMSGDGGADGVGLKGKSDGGVLIATSDGARMAYGSHKIWVANNGCWSSSALDTYSDARLKDEITYDLYERFADSFDTLKPCMYHYIDHPEGYSFGFIAQEVRDCMNTEENKLKIVNQSEDGMYALSYSMFTPINTAMIQDLRKRVKHLEEVLANGNISIS